MKKRTGLVSNSSSSSFVIALKKEGRIEKCPHCGRGGEYSLFQILEQSSDIDTQYFAGQEETIKNLEDRYEKARKRVENKQADHWDIENYNKLEEVIEAAEIKIRYGWEIHSLEISNHDYVAKELLNSLELSGDLEILNEEYL